MDRTRLVNAWSCALVFVVAATIVATTTASMGMASAESATAGSTAVRGESVQTRPPPAPPAVYPVGRCDALAPGLPGLEPRSLPEQMVEIGRSVEGRPIWAEYWGPADAEQVVMLVAQTHGNECSPTLVSAAVRARPPDRTGVWLIPTINPDGYARYERRNRNGVDLNSDGGNSVQQVETLALMDFLRSVRPTLTVYVHSPNGFIGAFPNASSPVAGAACREMSRATGLRCAGNGAGSRGPRNTWFLWQGQQDVLPRSEALLIELPAVAPSEVPNARPRPPTQSVSTVEAQVDAILEVIDGLR